ncbi:hypothetical protein BD410DRAFT_842325 [Rickenella mellea]|uniref:Uncharacterized protein n=1 Tax=Rickenella mellea TaxID=50990 RepID=A0A4Y7PUH5_9AGAM|nr:hypothetical protein BD410DRAFT_842325 [Rickenella mellea]
MARVTPDNGVGLNLAYDVSSLHGKDGELLDTASEYTQVFEMRGIKWTLMNISTGNTNFTGAGRAADLSGKYFTAYLNTEIKQVYPPTDYGYYDLIVGTHCKRILFDYLNKNSFNNRLPRAAFI